MPEGFYRRAKDRGIMVVKLKVGEAVRLGILGDYIDKLEARGQNIMFLQRTTRMLTTRNWNV